MNKEICIRCCKRAVSKVETVCEECLEKIRPPLRFNNGENMETLVDKQEQWRRTQMEAYILYMAGRHWSDSRKKDLTDKKETK